MKTFKYFADLVSDSGKVRIYTNARNMDTARTIIANDQLCPLHCVHVMRAPTRKQLARTKNLLRSL